jgi:hypothetical protein
MNPTSPCDHSARPQPQQPNISPDQTNAADNSPPPAPGRDARGRFAPGNPGGPGNPFARQVAKLRSALVHRVTEADMERIAEDLVVKARLGDLAAIKLLFLYVLGKPAATVNPDTLDIEEWLQTVRPIPGIMREFPAALGTMPVDTMNGAVRIVQPFVEEKFADMLAKPPERRERAPTPKEEKEPQRQDHPHTEPAACEPAQPSTNGGNGQPKAEGGPSANGSNGHPKPLPPWLAEIAAKMPPLPDHFGKGQRRRGKR